MDASGEDWGILAVSLKSATARDQLRPQDWCYTALELTSQQASPRTISALTEVLVAPEDPAAVLAALSDPEVRIVTLTITEKGYCHEPSTGRLNVSHPDIVHDLLNIDMPRSAPGFIVAALIARRHAGHAPFTVLSCDNLPSNGHVLQTVILDFATSLEPGLADWISAHVSFPSSMVDRITPATTDADIKRLEALNGIFDPALVVHEPFGQWVIEDRFPSGCPHWERAGVQMVRCVDAHETMKLRCLNGTHSALAYLGYLAGHETIAAAVSDTSFARLCERLWNNEILPTVATPEGEDLHAYCASLLERYRNTGIQHRTWQIAMDGSQKLPQRILATIRDNLARGHVPIGLCLVVAAWMIYVGGVDEKGDPIDVRDPLAATLRSLSDSADTVTDKVTSLLAVDEVFGRDLRTNAAFREAVERAYDTLVARGARRSVEAYVS